MQPCDLCFPATQKNPIKNTSRPKESSQGKNKNVCLMSCLLSPHYFVFGTQWFSLRDVPSGSVHLRLEWLSLLSSADRLSEVSLISLSTQEFNDVDFLCSLVFFPHLLSSGNICLD